MTENRFIVMTRTQTLYLLLISGFCSFTLGSTNFHLITLSKTYSEAKSYCREMYTDLATVHNSTDMNNLITLVSRASARAWIGLEAGDVWMWHWSSPDQNLDFFNWKAGEPQNTSEDACAAMDQHSEWFESDCGVKKSFVCKGNNDTSAHIFVPATKSWRDAQKHCRGLSLDLVSIHSAEENEVVRNLSVSKSVWIGLFKDPWKWSDGNTSSYRNWKPTQPNYADGQDCVAAIFKDTGQWNDLRCSGRRNFVCRGARRPDPSTPSHTTQTAPPQTTSAQEVTTAFNFTAAASTKHSNITNMSTKEATTATGLTTPSTTHFMSSASSTELSNATTEKSAVTATQQTPTATVQLTTDGVSAFTTVVGTSAQNTTQSSTLMTTENSQSLAPGNLILIQENMTWIEAMSYCREHHVDLVHITTKDIQEKVAEQAKKATSPHVWLGLRYTCNFNFWFWISSAPGCYWNWAPGQGIAGKYNCGVTGAIEATGRQQWVGLSETEKLNFICYACTE